jgi:hypothetical protein
MYYELRIVAATGLILVGFAGSSFPGGPHWQPSQDPDEDILGSDESSWGVVISDSINGRPWQCFHGCSDPPSLPPSPPLPLATFPYLFRFDMPVGRRGENNSSEMNLILQDGATVCVAWDGAAGVMLMSVDGAPYFSPFPSDTRAMRPSASVGAGLFPAICGFQGCVVEYSMYGDMCFTPPSPDYLPCAQVTTSQLTAHQVNLSTSFFLPLCNGLLHEEEIF